MEGTILPTGAIKFDGDAHGIAFSVYVRENGRSSSGSSAAGWRSCRARPRRSAATSRTWNSDRVLTGHHGQEVPAWPGPGAVGV